METDEPQDLLRDESEGLRWVRALIASADPPSPMARLLGTSVVAAETGSVTLTSSPGPETHSRRGGVHGGVLCTVLDTAVVLAAVTTCTRLGDFSTVDLSVHFLRPAPLGPLTVHAEVLKPGSRLTFAQGSVLGPDGRVVASATGTVIHD